MTCHNCQSRCKKSGKHRNGLQRFRCNQCRKTFTEDHPTPLGGMYTPVDKASKVIELLAEGCSISTVERVTGIHHTTILSLLVLVGEKCERLLEAKIHRICTSHVEKHNLTMRMAMRRFTRLTNAFSRKWNNLKAALALYFAWYNFVHIHRSIRMTPAMAAGITDHIWTITELVEAVA
jgi:transposase-like protein